MIQSYYNKRIIGTLLLMLNIPWVFQPRGFQNSNPRPVVRILFRETMNEPFSFLISLFCNCYWPSAEDEHDVVWFWLEKGKPHECPVCTQYFTVGCCQKKITVGLFPFGIRSMHSKRKSLLTCKLLSLSLQLNVMTTTTTNIKVV
jgi:hypothetical protein